MKFIMNNMYIKPYSFGSYRDFALFIDKQKLQGLKLEKSYGDKYYCYLVCDSLTHEKLLGINFESNYEQKDLNILFWSSKNLIVIETGMYFYVLDETMRIKYSFEAQAPLISLYITKKENLLVLEEASLRLIDSKGVVLKEELFDFLDEFTLKENQLFLIIDGDKKSFKLD